MTLQRLTERLSVSQPSLADIDAAAVAAAGVARMVNNRPGGEEADQARAGLAYVELYGIDFNYRATLVAADGANCITSLRKKQGEVSKPFAMPHVTPLQVTPGRPALDIPRSIGEGL